MDLSSEREAVTKALAASRYAYQIKEDCVGKVYEPISLTIDLLLINERKQIRGFIASSEREVIISIAGTESAHDVLADAEIEMREARICDIKVKVHEGFLAECESVMDEVDEWFNKFGHSGETRKFLVTGHSLGGAVATLLSLRLFEYLGFAPKVITFGSPRVGDRSLRKLFNARIADGLRFVHNHDIVPWMPIWPYKHLGCELHIDDNGKRIGAVHRVWASIRSFFHNIFSVVTGHALTDHFMDKYHHVVEIFMKQFQSKDSK
jgi:predicted lipase